MGHIVYLRNQFKSMNISERRDDYIYIIKLVQQLRRRRLLNFVKSMYFRNFVNISPLEKGGSLHLNKFESLLTKDTLCQVLMKLAQWFWRRRFFKNINVFSQFGNYLLLEKGGSLHLNKFESLSPKDALCQVLLKLTQGFWRRRRKCEKFTTAPTTKLMEKF